MKVTVLHPGAMGVAIASSVKRAGHEVRCVLNGRSQESIDRAKNAGLMDIPFAVAVSTSEIIISVCPPHAAEQISTEVSEQGYTGIYVDANAISPDRTCRIASIVSAGGSQFVDGGIVGGPPKERNQCYLYLSGRESKTVAQLFSEGLIESQVISDKIGDASAMKMCYAAYTKGSTAMLLAIVAASEELGVRDTLFEQWSREGSNLDETSVKRARFVPRKAWRWIDEMEEISKTFESVGQPSGFHASAAEVYKRLKNLRPSGEDLAEFDEVLKALRNKE